MKILRIGQLPREVGGNYTTGIAKVVYELSRQKTQGDTLFTFATNIKDKNAQKLSSYDNEYIGYRFLIIPMVLDIVFHPARFCREWKSYREIGANPLRFFFYKVNFKRAIKLIQPDIIHYNGGGLRAFYHANTSKIPVVFTYHGVMYKGTKETEQYKKGEEGTLGYYDYATGLTNETRKEMISLGVPSDIISIIPNGCDCGKFYYDQESRETVRKQYAVSNNTYVFITVGGLLWRKGQFTFLKALEQIGVDYQYWLVGEGPDKAVIQQYCEERGIVDRVKFFGYVDNNNLYKLHSAADYYAHVSTTEGQALSEVEAYATGLRVIVNKAIANTTAGDAHKDTDDYYIIDFDKLNPTEIKMWFEKSAPERATRSGVDWHLIEERYHELFRGILKS